MISENINIIKQELSPFHATLVAVSKTKPVEMILEAYQGGQRIFGENYVQELVEKQKQLPADIEWHFIGHLQSNKAKYIAPFVSLIHSVDSFKLLKAINKEALNQNRIINCLLQIFIAEEETKFGFSIDEAYDLLLSNELSELKNISIIGLMGMATNTDNEEQIRNEFKSLNKFFDRIKDLKTNSKNMPLENFQPKELSFGMSGDYKIALQEGSTMIRIGSMIFGNRIYPDAK
jgi:hypothetical protein